MTDQQNRVAPCMGGFCPRRTSCAHYCAPSDRVEPSEHLCKRGGPDQFAPLGAAQRVGVPA